MRGTLAKHRVSATALLYVIAGQMSASEVIHWPAFDWRNARLIEQSFQFTYLIVPNFYCFLLSDIILEMVATRGECGAQQARVR